MKTAIASALLQMKTAIASALLLLSIHAALTCDPTEDLHAHEEIEITMMAEADHLSLIIE
jgi:hypothetical protein